MDRTDRQPRWPAVAICSLCSAWAAQADAQTFDEAFQLETLDPGSSSTSIYGVETSSVTGHMVPTADLWFFRTNRPFVQGDRSIVDDRWTVVFGGGFGLTDRLQLDVHLPMVLRQTGPGLLDDGVVASGATGDVRLRAKWLALQSGSFGVGLVATMWTESGSIEGFTSNRVVRGEPGFVVDTTLGPALVSFNAGYQFRRTRESTGYRHGDALRWGTATRMPLWGGFGVEGSVFGEWIPGGTHDNASPIEALGGLFYQRDGARVSLGAGTGVHRDVGAPRYRLTLGLSYAFGGPEPGRSVGPQDPDGDGLLGDADQCPHHAETYDGFEDYDGCPDPDDDADGVADVADACPGASGVAAKAGCPFFDVDEDSIDDAVDACPRQPEDIDGDADEDGCPDAPTEVAEAADCADSPGGCEDAELPPRRETIDDRLYFGTDSTDFEPEKSPLLDEMVVLMERDPTIETMIIEGHTDDRGSEEHNRQLAKARASAVRDVLVQNGIAPGRIDVRAIGESAPRATNDTVEGRAENRRVEFRLIRAERPEPVAIEPKKSEIEFGLGRFRYDRRGLLAEDPARFVEGARLEPPASHRCAVDGGAERRPLVLGTAEREPTIGTTFPGRDDTRSIECVAPDGSKESLDVAVEIPGFALVGGVVRNDRVFVPRGGHAIVEVQFSGRSLPLDVDAPGLRATLVRVTRDRSRLLLVNDGAAQAGELRIGVANRTILRVPVDVVDQREIPQPTRARRVLELGVGSAIMGPVTLEDYTGPDGGAVVSSVRYTARFHANEWFSAGLVGDVGPLLGVDPIRFMPGVGFEGVVHAPLPRFRPFVSAGFESWFPALDRALPALEASAGLDWEPENGAGIRAAGRVVVLTDAGETMVLPGGFLGVFTSFR